jgi:hypothetical protein
MSSSEVGTLKQAFEAAGGHWSTFVIWSKNAFTLGRSDYQRQYLWQHDRPTKNDLHPTMKPVGLVERAIRNSSKSRDTILADLHLWPRMGRALARGAGPCP